MIFVRRIIAPFCVALLVVLARCANPETPVTATTPPAKAPDAVSVRLDWLPQAQFAGVYVAQDKGYFKNKNLKVTINPGGVNLNPIQLVASGSDTFGMANADQILVARSKGINLVGVAAVFQKNPVVFIARKASGIKKPQDFVGKRVGVKYGTSPDILYRALLRSLNINEKRVKEVPVQFDMSSFFTGQVDVWPGYAINEALIAKEKNADPVIIDPSEYGVHDYADVVFVRDDYLRAHPDIVKRFVDALLDGWRDALSNPDAAVATLTRLHPDLDPKHEQAMMAAVVPLVTVANGRLGSMEPEKWKTTYDFLAQQKQLDRTFDVHEAYSLGALTGNGQ